ncbi:hypothetical protein E1B28_003649 [Marasmius oreades]|uniref:Uncharacterized protein n=1 Tax=Marasmius oreades TaxID=181124 RepID=A0A9P7UX02_9AGAR|nr:uncharacterized protein E1B28_003649 [Marasmius oreades]KAG7096199.1 hypothetical protein E1B28_003649 [Marasmius oreades]
MLKKEREGLVPIWDVEERIYRCVLCVREIIERECQKPERGEAYLDYVYEESPDGISLDASNRTFHLCDESYLLPSMRSTTPASSYRPQLVFIQGLWRTDSKVAYTSTKLSSLAGLLVSCTKLSTSHTRPKPGSYSK